MLIVAGAACGGEARPPADATTQDSAGIAITTINATPASVPVWGVDTQPLTTLESPDSTGFVFVSAAHRLSGGRLLVADARQRRLHLYDAAGRHLRTLGRDGSGPGEFRGLMTVSVVGDTIGTWDLSARRFSIFTADSGYRQLVEAPAAPNEYDTAREIWITAGRQTITYWLRGEYPGPLPQGMRIRRWQFTGQITASDSSGDVLATSPTFNGIYTGQSERGDARQLFSNSPFVAVGNLIAYGSGEEFEVRIAGHELVTRQIVRWSLADEPLTGAEVASARERLLESMPPGAPRERIEAAVDNIVAAELLPETRPAISRALWDDAGRLWVGKFDPPVRGLAEAFEWVVFDEAMRPQGRLRLPDNARLESVLGDELLVSVRDSLDVQTVQIWRFRALGRSAWTKGVAAQSSDRSAALPPASQHPASRARSSP